jgi:hypothetical protein
LHILVRLQNTSIEPANSTLSRLGILIDPSQVRLRTTPDYQYIWEIFLSLHNICCYVIIHFIHGYPWLCGYGCGSRSWWIGHHKISWVGYPCRALGPDVGATQLDVVDLELHYAAEYFSCSKQRMRNGRDVAWSMQSDSRIGM